MVTTHHYSPFTMSPMSPVQVSPSPETDLGHSHSSVLIPWGLMTLARSWLWVSPAPALASLSLTAKTWGRLGVGVPGGSPGLLGPQNPSLPRYGPCPSASPGSAHNDLPRTQGWTSAAVLAVAAVPTAAYREQPGPGSGKGLETGRAGVSPAGWGLRGPREVLGTGAGLRKARCSPVMEKVLAFVARRGASRRRWFAGADGAGAHPAKPGEVQVFQQRGQPGKEPDREELAPLWSAE